MAPATSGAMTGIRVLLPNSVEIMANFDPGDTCTLADFLLSLLRSLDESLLGAFGADARVLKAGGDGGAGGAGGLVDVAGLRVCGSGASPVDLADAMRSCAYLKECAERGDLPVLEVTGDGLSSEAVAGGWAEDLSVFQATTPAGAVVAAAAEPSTTAATTAPAPAPALAPAAVESAPSPADGGGPAAPPGDDAVAAPAAAAAGESSLAGLNMAAMVAPPRTTSRQGRQRRMSAVEVLASAVATGTTHKPEDALSIASSSADQSDASAARSRTASTMSSSSGSTAATPTAAGAGVGAGTGAAGSTDDAPASSPDDHMLRPSLRPRTASGVQAISKMAKLPPLRPRMASGAGSVSRRRRHEGGGAGGAALPSSRGAAGAAAGEQQPTANGSGEGAGAGAGVPAAAAGTGAGLPADGAQAESAKRGGEDEGPEAESDDVVAALPASGEGGQRLNRRLSVRPTSELSLDASSEDALAIDFVLPDGSTLTLNCPGSATVTALKRLLWERLLASPPTKHGKSSVSSGNRDHYVLKYDKEGRVFQVYDEDQVLETLAIVDWWRATNTRPALRVVNIRKAVSKEEKFLSARIGNLIGYGLFQYDFLKDTQIDTFRRKIVGVRQAAIRERDPTLYALNPHVDSNALPPNLAAKLVSGKVQVRLRLGEFSQTSTKTIAVGAQETPAQIMAQVVPKYLSRRPEGTGGRDFLLKVVGLEDYLYGDHPLVDFRHVRRCLLKNKPVELVVAQSAEAINVDDFIEEEANDLVDESTGTLGTHQQITCGGRPHGALSTISIWDVARKFKVKVVGVDNLQVGSVQTLYVDVGIYYGGRLIAPAAKTEQVLASSSPRWGAWLNFDLATRDIPREARLCITVHARWNAKKKLAADKKHDRVPVGWVNMLLMDYKGFLRSGLIRLNLWGGAEPANPIGTTVQNHRAADCAALYIELERFARPVAFPSQRYENEYRDLVLPPPPNEADNGRLEAIMAGDPLAKLTGHDIELLWLYRYYCMSRPEALSKFLVSVRWNCQEDVQEVHKMLLAWHVPPPEAALELLDSNFADARVRSYAVARLEQLSDDQLHDFLLQLVQVLKYEPYHDSALARFLLRRSLKSKTLGYSLFWYLRSEMHLPEISQRFGLLLEAYTRACGSHMLDSLSRQRAGIKKLCDVANAIKPLKGSEKRPTMHALLRKASIETPFPLAYEPSVVSGPVIIEKCKYMDSKKLPLWIVSQNADPAGGNILYIFKSGDDLRQDMLTLQMIRIMDKLWQQDNLDLRMQPYGCISTGDEQGFIEVVENSNTVSNIQQDWGGSTAAFKDEPLLEWIKTQCAGSDTRLAKAVETFTLSCAGYCVATYVLGIGDRHNDNVMVTKEGHLFHIDFGHFLGNIKRKFGFKRERAPFVLTPDFVYVMGGRNSKNFEHFVALCQRAFLIVRRHANMFISLFAMMLSTGIPELKCADDINYLRDALCLDKTEAQAAEEFKQLIATCLSLSWSTQLNWWIHNLVH